MRFNICVKKCVTLKSIRREKKGGGGKCYFWFLKPFSSSFHISYFFLPHVFVFLPVLIFHNLDFNPSFYAFLLKNIIQNISARNIFSYKTFLIEFNVVAWNLFPLPQKTEGVRSSPCGGNEPSRSKIINHIWGGLGEWIDTQNMTVITQIILWSQESWMMIIFQIKTDSFLYFHVFHFIFWFGSINTSTIHFK